MKPGNLFDWLEDQRNTCRWNDGDWEALRPAEATTERPGSKGKIKVMRERLERGEELTAAGDVSCASDANDLVTVGQLRSTRADA